MSRQDRVLTRRSVLGGLALGVGLTGAAGAAGAFDRTRLAPDGPTSDDTGSAGTAPADTPSTNGATDPPEGPLAVAPPRREFYSRPSASAGQTFGDAFLPQSGTRALPVVVLVHGGGWGQGLGLDYMAGYARDLASHDVAVWNVEYRRTGSGGGWPTTVADVCDAVDFLPALGERLGGRLDLGRVVVCGHSAGGHLALWVAARPRLPEHLPGARPAQVVTGCVSLAGVADLLRAEAAGDGFVHGLLGGTPAEVRQRYVDASPLTHLPTGIPVACLHGSDDKVVRPVQSEEYVRRARAAGDPARLEIHPGGDHDPWGNLSGEPWRIARGILLQMAGASARTRVATPGQDSTPGPSSPGQGSPPSSPRPTTAPPAPSSSSPPTPAPSNPAAPSSPPPPTGTRSRAPGQEGPR